MDVCAHKEKTPIQTRILALLALALFVACNAPLDATEPPLPPQLPRDSQWEGRWIVRDLGVDVPFTWQGKDGNVQMIAGGEEYPIHFTNLIYNDQLYTLTYKWPDTVPPLPDDDCICIGRLTLDELNLCLDSSRYVGAEILLEETELYVNHFRVSVVLGDSETKPNPVRVPIMEGDFYVDQEDSSKFWRVLHFGFQNLLDPALDEWAVMQKFKDTAGGVTFPPECIGKCKNDDPAFPPGFFCN
jgi:hypothetical protein